MRCIAFLLLLATAIAHADELPRVKIADGTLVAPDGRPLRGVPFFMDIYGVPDMHKNEDKYHEYFNSIFKQHDLNCVRLGLWMGDWKYDIAGDEKLREEYLYAFDKTVDWCEENDIYAVVNLHIRYKTTVDLEKAKAFWSIIAPRYKDRTHVIYELLNEPEPKSSIAANADLYQHVKSLAPDTHQILFSHVAATQLKPAELADATKGVDFTNASIGFHCYESVLLNTVQWDHAQKIRKAGFPVICTEFISLTNNNDMPIDYDHLMHCMMRAEERKMAWISWGPFAQYRNPNKKDWTHNALRFSGDFTAAKRRYGVDFKNVPQWPSDGVVRFQNVHTGNYLAREDENAWNAVKLVPKGDSASTAWKLERFDGNNYRIRSSDTETIFLHGKFDDDRTWLPTITGEAHADWNSQKFQLLRTGDDTYQIRCRWGELYLTAAKEGVRTAPLTNELNQHWTLIK